MKRYKIKKITETVLILLFILVIFTPPIATIITSSSDGVSMTEKRKLAPLPSITASGLLFADHTKQCENYLNGHIGFRKHLIHLHNYIKLFWLRVSPSERVLIGKDGWYFITNNNSIKDFRGLDPLTPDELKRWKDALEARKRWLGNQGIQYMFVVAPGKQSIYPEFFPPTYNKVNDKTHLDQLMEYLEKYSTVKIVDLRPHLLKEKNNSSLYYKTDTHWNANGALVAYNAIMDNMWKFFPEEPQNNTMLMKKNPIGGYGDLQTMLAAGKLPDEPFLVYVPISPLATKKELSIDLATGHQPKDRKPFKTSCDTRGIKAIVLRDSFFTSLVPIFSEHFEEAIYIWRSYDHNAINDLIKYMKPDIVIEELVERYLKEQTPKIPTHHNNQIRQLKSLSKLPRPALY